MLLALWAMASPAPADGPPLVVKGELTPTDPLDRVQKQSHTKAHLVELKAGQAILAHLRSIDFDPMLRVEDDKGKVLGSNDDIIAGVQTNSRLGFVAPAAGTYRLVVTTFDPGRTGEYLLEVAALEPAGAPVVLKGKLTDQSPQAQGQRYQLHKLTTEPGRWYLFDLTAADFAPSLVLRDGKGKLFAQDQGGGAGRDARLVWPSESVVPWVIQVVAGRTAGGGDYQLAYRAYAGKLTAGATDREKLYGEAVKLSERSVTCYQAGRFEECNTLVGKALAMQRKVYPEAQYPQGHPDLAASLNNLGELLTRAGRYEAARDYFEQALAMRRKLYPEAQFPEGHSLLAASLSDLGVLMGSAGRHEAARNYHEQALAMRRKLFPEAQYPHGHPGVALSLNNLGVLMESAGRYEAARDFLEQALAMRRKLYPAAQYPQGHPDLANSLNSLGALMQSAGRYEAARDCHEQALAMYRKLYPAAQYPQGHPDLAMSLNNLGELMDSAGHYEAARDLYERALAMRRKLYPAAQYPQGHPGLASSLNSLGALMGRASRYEAARDFLEQAVAMRRKLYPEAQYPHGHPDLANSLNSLGSLLMDGAGHYEAARDYYEEALAMYRRLYPEAQYPQGHPNLATSLDDLGVLMKRAGRYEAARDFLEQAVAMRRKLYPAAQYPHGHPDLARSLHNFGMFKLSAGGFEEALTHLQPAVTMENTLTLREITFAPEAEALDLLSQLPPTGDGYLTAALVTGAQAKKVYAEVWPRKALLSRLLQRRHQATRAAQAHDPQVRRAWEDLTSVRSELNRRLSEPARDAALQTQEVSRLTSRKEKLERELAALLPELERGGELDKLGPPDLAGQLPEGVAFVDLVHYTHFGEGLKGTARYVAFLALPDRTVKLIELKDAAPIDQAVRAWRERIAAYRDTPGDARAVAALVWDPIAKELPAHIKGLYVAPDGALAGLPWAALPGKKAGTVLLEDLAIAVVPHGPFLLEQLKYPSHDVPGQDAVVAVGAVDYGAADPAPYAPLPGTAAELAKLSEAAGKRPVTLLQKDQARWDLLKDRLPGARYAHLATHGYYDAKALALEQQRLREMMEKWQSGPDAVRPGHGARSPLGFTGLALAGANLPGKGGIVTGEALIELPLEGMRLCVLSACESGLGDLGPLSGEGVQGLPRALHLAGCANVVSSLWNVNDRATAALMGKFYHELWQQGRTPLEALREAQLMVYRHPELIDELSRSGPTALKKLALPTGPAGKTAPTKLWAGFVLSGVGR